MGSELFFASLYKEHAVVFEKGDINTQVGQKLSIYLTGLLFRARTQKFIFHIFQPKHM